MALVTETYLLTDGFPKREMYGLTSQMRGAAVSIPANIAEGHARHSTGDYLRFLAIANGSLRELETYIELGIVLRQREEGAFQKTRSLAEETGRLLMGLRRALRSGIQAPSLTPQSSPLAPSPIPSPLPSDPRSPRPSPAAPP